MKLSTSIPIKANSAQVWDIISDIEHSVDNISAIEKIEVLEKPSSGLVGLKWVETRKMFGKTATETMWITEAEQNKYYRTRAESHGSIYRSNLSIKEEAGGCVLEMGFDAEPQNFGAKLMSGVFGFMLKGSMKKALKKDLEDIKRLAESKAGNN